MQGCQQVKLHNRLRLVAAVVPAGQVPSQVLRWNHATTYDQRLQRYGRLPLNISTWRWGPWRCWMAGQTGKCMGRCTGQTVQT